MTAAMNTFDALTLWKRREPGKEAEFKKNYPREWEIVQGIRELRKHG